MIQQMRNQLLVVLGHALLRPSSLVENFLQGHQSQSWPWHSQQLQRPRLFCYSGFGFCLSRSDSEIAHWARTAGLHSSSRPIASIAPPICACPKAFEHLVATRIA